MAEEQIHDWKYTEDGVWEYSDDEIKVFASIWENIDIKKAFMACVRWQYKGNSYGTYIKFPKESIETKEKALAHVGLYVSTWLKDEKSGEDKPQCQEKA